VLVGVLLVGLGVSWFKNGAYLYFLIYLEGEKQ
jgi:hypothetical protein